MAGKNARVRTPALEPEHAWERQPKEGDKPWSAFLLYREMQPGERSLLGVVRKLADRGEKKSRALMTRWSAEWDWVARVRAYDAFLDRKKRDAELQEIADMRKRHINISMMLQSLAATAAKRFMEIERDNKRAKKPLKPQHVKELMELGAKLERISRGEPDTIAQNEPSESNRYVLTIRDVGPRKAEGDA